MSTTAAQVVRTEAEALLALAERLAGPMAPAFDHALGLLHNCKGRVIVTGIGKSGIIARKLAATFSSTGAPAFFLHPAESIHGDMGVIVHGDVAIALSASGETDEVIRLLPVLQRLEVPLISITCDAICAGTSKLSTLAAAASVALDCSVAQEACNLGLAPTASTTSMLALGDALAVALSQRRNFRAEDFAALHPGGKLGRKLTRVEELMHSGDALPQVAPTARMADVIFEMSSKKLGVTAVAEPSPQGANAPGNLVGIVSDGDLRRLLERYSREAGSSDGGGDNRRDVLDLTAADCMTRNPKTVSPGTFAATALAMMEEKKITSLCVVGAQAELLGIIHMHDLWESLGA